VSISSTFYRRFFVQTCFAQIFFSGTVWFCNFWQKNIVAKAARKMLMKLTTVIDSSLQHFAGVWCIINAVVGFFGNLLTLLAFPYASWKKKFESFSYSFLYIICVWRIQLIFHVFSIY